MDALEDGVEHVREAVPGPRLERPEGGGGGKGAVGFGARHGGGRRRGRHDGGDAKGNGQRQEQAPEAQVDPQ